MQWLAIALMIGAAALFGCAGPAPDTISYPSQPVAGSRIPEKPIPAQLALPSGPGPFPAVILLHTCSGRSPNQQFWVDRLRGWGYAVLVPDSFAPRDIRSVCAPQNQSLARPRDRVADAINAALYLRTRPEIDGSRIAVLGESHGGATAARLSDAQYAREYPGLIRAVVDYYGGCEAFSGEGTTPLLVLAGELDDWGNPALTCRQLESHAKPPQDVEVVVYPGVYHSFDNEGNAARSISFGHVLQYDHSAASDSYQKVRAFLAQWMAPR